MISHEFKLFTARQSHELAQLRAEKQQIQMNVNVASQVCVCVCVSVCVCMGVYVHAHTRARARARARENQFAGVCARTYLCVRVCMCESCFVGKCASGREDGDRGWGWVSDTLD